MSTPTLKDRVALTQEWIRRFLAYQTTVTWFGPLAVMRAIAIATATLTEGGYQLYVALLRRWTLLASTGRFLSEVAAEAGTERAGAQRAKVFVVLQPRVADVVSIATTSSSLIRIEDSTDWTVGESLRVVNGDGSSEVRTIIAITTGTGPGGEDEIEVASLVGTYTDDPVTIVVRKTLPIDTRINTTTGVSFATLAAVTTGERNPILAGESTNLGLADKVWCEAVTAGALGNIDALAVTGLETPVDGIVAVTNPEPGTGGADEETDLDVKYRTSHRPAIANQETLAWVEALAKEGNGEVLRAVRLPVRLAGIMSVKALRNNGGTFNSNQIAALETYLGARVRSYMTVDIDNVELTAIEVEAQITLDPDAVLATVWRSACSRLVDYLDHRKWEFGGTVDEAQLLAIVLQTPGVATLDTPSFLPSTDTTVETDSLPVLARLSLLDLTSGERINADLAVGFP